VQPAIFERRPPAQFGRELVGPVDPLVERVDACLVELVPPAQLGDAPGDPVASSASYCSSSVRRRRDRHARIRPTPRSPGSTGRLGSKRAPTPRRRRHGRMRGRRVRVWSSGPSQDNNQSQKCIGWQNLSSADQQNGEKQSVLDHDQEMIDKYC
jgi:hypothetical protein